MSLSFSPGQRAVLDLRTAEWGNRVNDYVSTGTQNLRANNEQSTIHTHNTTWQSEGPQFTHDSQTHVGTESTTARHLIFPEMADRTTIYSTPTTGEDGITDNRTGGINHGALASDGSTGHQVGSEFMPRNSQES
ncbi:uncharacterized protein N7473_005620 [Penicillium subrubescens]|uniref:Uncharacterized protein n=1 Tax=Penicillium subrubescens TaxID=1316194 RepID=A0A1Q5T5R6_9EURO|nr:uncharacterized protein N7473_005620 [Penicillium subrubescens]KAJ5896221.1 hypothetical protein N7473_005620 [Penicillium subrubescens]OKO95586.1 hypothetical protein PENSUB_11098 [Penicillium subrubescens]